MNPVLVIAILCMPLQGIIIKVDYRFDREGFFDNPSARAVVEAAAARWSRVVDQTLLPVNMQDEALGSGRFQVIHPATGETYILSAAKSSASDFYVQAGQPAADEYLGGFTLDQDVWILFVGARVLDNDAARGGPIGGAGNVGSVYSDADSFLNRGFNLGQNSLTVMGGVISFNLDQNWNLNLADPTPAGKVDLYGIALHEIGHGLGLNSRAAAEWKDLLDGARFTGRNAIAAYEKDSGTDSQGLLIENASDRNYHWKSDLYTSRIFPLGVPLYYGTVGRDGFQSLLMEPAYASGAGPLRSEITNVDVGALRDLGWSTISQNPPVNAELPISFRKSPGGGLSLQLISEIGATYTVQTSPDGLSWVNVIPSLRGDGEALSWSDGQEGFLDPYGPASALAGKYYRVIKN